jgi:hypothetical protein
MAQNKTQKQQVSVQTFLDNIDDPEQLADSKLLIEMMSDISGCEPVMWGEQMVGFDEYHYQYASGHGGDWFMCGFAPRKGKMSLYIMDGFNNHAPLMQKLGKHKTGKSCLYVKRLSDINLDVLKTLIAESIGFMRAKYPKA